ncbi:hypothetical protein ACSMXM_16875 [Pacificimonas sp. ICDLI1SI03]
MIGVLKDVSNEVGRPLAAHNEVKSVLAASSRATAYGHGPRLGHIDRDTAGFDLDMDGDRRRKHGDRRPLQPDGAFGAPIGPSSFLSNWRT